MAVETAKRTPARMWSAIIGSIVVLLLICPIAVFSLTPRSGYGIQVRWHLDEWHFGTQNDEVAVTGITECFEWISRGFRLGIVDVVRVTRNPPSRELPNVTNAVPHSP